MSAAAAPNTRGDTVVVAIPIHKPSLDPYEFFGLWNSLRVLAGRQAFFFAPQGLDVAFYAQHFSQVRVLRFPGAFFDSTESYSRLMTSKSFYEAFDAYVYLLLLQPDAVVFRDELDAWIARGHDYVGAPWPWWQRFPLPADAPLLAGMSLRLGVGNGGLSLRRVAACRAVIDEAAWLLDRGPIVEDEFFAACAHLTTDFRVPGMLEAARFALECRPDLFLPALDGRAPMGFHAWRRFGSRVCPAWFRQAGFVPVRASPSVDPLTPDPASR